MLAGDHFVFEGKTEGSIKFMGLETVMVGDVGGFASGLVLFVLGIFADGDILSSHDICSY
jgi:hypothetical protein